MAKTASRLLPACAAVLLASGCAAYGDRITSRTESRRECFFPSQVTGFSGARDDRVLIHTGPRDYFLFETFGYCPNLDFTQRLALDPVGPGTICTGLDIDLIVPSPIGPRRCPIRMIRKLDEGEFAAP